MTLTIEKVVNLHRELNGEFQLIRNRYVQTKKALRKQEISGKTKYHLNKLSSLLQPDVDAYNNFCKDLREKYGTPTEDGQDYIVTSGSEEEKKANKEVEELVKQEVTIPGLTEVLKKFNIDMFDFKDEEDYPVFYELIDE